jgi:hypothetical protein
MQKWTHPRGPTDARDVQSTTATPEATKTQKEDIKQSVWTRSSRQKATGSDTDIPEEESIPPNQRLGPPAELFVRD